MPIETTTIRALATKRGTSQEGRLLSTVTGPALTATEVAVIKTGIGVAVDRGTGVGDIVGVDVAVATGVILVTSSE